jgi:hypothetical protein
VSVVTVEVVEQFDSIKRFLDDAGGGSVNICYVFNCITFFIVVDLDRVRLLLMYPLSSSANVTAILTNVHFNVTQGD